MIVNKYNKGGGGSISGGSADYATLAGESNKTKLLEGGSTIPQSANTGDVVALAPNPSRGTRAQRTLGIYQYDGTNWNKIEGGEGSSAYKIELTEVNPELYTQQDIDTINAFCAAFTADTSIADSAYISALGGIYRCVRYIAIPHSPIFTFEGPFNNNIVDISLIFRNDLFSYGGLQNAVPTPPTPDFNYLEPTTELPEDPVDGEIVLLSEEEFIEDKPEAPDGQTVYGGNLADFIDAVKGTSNNQLWVKTWDDAGHTERTDQGYFHLESDAINYYDYQGDMEYLYDDLGEGEWVDANTICLWREGKNLYFYVKQEAEGVFFPDTDATMVFDTVITDNTLNQYGDGDWMYFPHVLYSRGEFPKLAGLGDVVGIGKYGEREATSADVFTSATVTMVNGRATFKMYNPNYSGYCEDYTFGYDENEGIIGGWGGEKNVINGPWSDHGVEFSIDGDNITFTSQNPENTEEALQMWGFDPNCNDRITTKELGLYQRDEDGWNEIPKVTDLPADNRLVPEGGGFNDYLRKGGDGPEWVSIRQVPFTDMQKDYTGAVLMSKSIYADEYGWDFIRTDMLKPKSSLPVQGEDGAVYALSSSGYGIVQAQSAHTGQGWFNYNGKSVPSGFTQIRVPYNDTAESNLVHFKTDPNGEGDCNIYWHPEDSSNRRWDGLPNDPAQNDGEFSTTDDWGNTMVGTKVGDYIVVTFGAAVVNGGDPSDPMRADNHTEIYSTGSITDYKSVVMSNSINSIVKLTQAEYDALVSGGTVDENTFYIIVANPQS